MTEKKKLNNKQLKAVEFLVYTDMLKQDIAKEGRAQSAALLF